MLKKLSSTLGVFFLFYSHSVLAGMRIVFIGDSLTEGFGVAKNQAYPARIEEKLKGQYPDLELVNAGMSGATSQVAVTQIKWHIKHKKPHLIVLALGANDGLRGYPLSKLETNLEKAIVFAQENEVPIILVGMRLPINYAEPYRTDFEKVYARLAQKHKIDFVPFLIENVAMEKELNLEDRIHPNEKGHEMMAKQLLPIIEKKIKQLSAPQLKTKRK